MVSKLQLFSIYSFLYVFLDPHKNFHVQEELTNIVFFLFKGMIMLYMLVNPCFLMLVKSKTNSSCDNPWEWWMVLVAASWIGNWIYVMINDWDLPTIISLMISSIGVHFYSMLL
jgi:NAD/NADP transhydrogenase beta subunit